MTECRQIESLLPPYVDGEASARDAARVDAHLAACEACARLVQAQRTVRTVLRARAASLATPAPPGLATRLSALLDRRRPALGWVGRLSALGAAAVLMLALVTGFEFLSPRSGVLFAAQLAIDHLRCFVLAVGRLDGSDPATLKVQYAEQHGWAVPVPGSNPELDLTFMGARRCPFGLGDHAHLLYRSGGQDVSLYITPGEARTAEQRQVLGHAERIWSSGGNSYAIVARGLSDAALARIAGYFEQATRDASWP
jgi:anti-sigma factor RsiW